MIDELEKVAKAATHGHYVAHRGCSPDVSNFVKVDNKYLTEDDAVYLATASPETILKLVAVVRAAKGVPPGECHCITDPPCHTCWSCSLYDALRGLGDP